MRGSGYLQCGPGTRTLSMVAPEAQTLPMLLLLLPAALQSGLASDIYRININDNNDIFDIFIKVLLGPEMQFPLFSSHEIENIKYIIDIFGKYRTFSIIKFFLHTIADAPEDEPKVDAVSLDDI